MPSYAQLEQEPWWDAELEAPATARLNHRLREHFDMGPELIGSKGDNNHLRGRHRSINWDLNSQYCTDRAYGTTDLRDRRGNWNHLRAGDVGITGAVLRGASARLDKAVRAGRLPGLAEWFGTIDGVTVVGWFEGYTSSSSSSHLYHLHWGVWTDHTDHQPTMDLLYDLITGTAGVTEEPDMFLFHYSDEPDGQTWVSDGTRRRLVTASFQARNVITAGGAKLVQFNPADLPTGYTRDQFLTGACGPIDMELPGGTDGGSGLSDADKTWIAGQLAALRVSVEADTEDAVADLGEGGSAKVRAD